MHLGTVTARVPSLQSASMPSLQVTTRRFATVALCASASATASSCHVSYFKGVSESHTQRQQHQHHRTNHTNYTRCAFR
eukprot:scaffold312925_cov23-Tisochrysis_lutea.AAC.1